MIERIIDVHGIGLLNQANGKPFTLKKSTFLYADNGRGKSTLASIFQSLSAGDSSPILSRKTVDGTHAQRVSLQFNSGHKVEFDKGSWSESRPEIHVFDVGFIDRNVYSGGSVSTDHRKNLLEFALGEPAVAARQKVADTTAKAKVEADKLQQLITQMSGYHAGITVSQFENLPKIESVDEKIQEVNKRITTAQNVEKVLLKPLPSLIELPSLEIEKIFSILSLSLKDVHKDAENVVKEHIAKLNKPNAESWLSQGQLISEGETCPYCNQDIKSNNLIKAYQTHFNNAYNDLKAKVSGLSESVLAHISEKSIENIATEISNASKLASGWGEHLQIQEIKFEKSNVEAALVELRQLLENLTSSKELSPSDELGNKEQKEQALNIWTEILKPIKNANEQIKAAIDSINTYKDKLQSENVEKLNQELLILKLSKIRHQEPVVGLFKQVVAARASSKSAEADKKTARETLDSLMATTLNKYEAVINQLLQKFGAAFTIQGMSANFRGGAPRSEYGLLLRGKNVSLEGASPSFSTALSEGDKRTLAFSFFLASVFEDPEISKKTILIDDPMCSLDLNRRHQTRVVLRKLNEMSEQLIVFAHDPYFLRDLRDFFLKKDKTLLFSCLQLVTAKDDYSDFGAIDLDKECESDYFRYHRTLNDFLIAVPVDNRLVAKSIRPLLEGYLHRRFPNYIPKDLLFGQIVILIRDADAANPLSHAKNLVNELNEINEYAGQFHHNTNPDPEGVAIVAAELRLFVDRALKVVHRGA